MAYPELQCKCQNCGHEWLKRIISEPVMCPRCKSYNWNKDKKKNNRAATQTNSVAIFMWRE